MEFSGLNVGFISNGNRTWAKRVNNTATPTDRQLLDAYYHGSERVKGVVEAARDAGFRSLMPWGLSDKNIVKRPENERGCLYQIFEHYLTDLRDNFMHKEENQNVRFAQLGRKDRLAKEAPNVIRLIDEIYNDTRQRTGMVLAVALDYGGREEYSRAIKLWADAGCPGGPDGVKAFLDLPLQGIEFQPVDLIIRTGHKPEEAVRTNEYLFGYLEETRVVPSPILLPDYTKEDFLNNVRTYKGEKKNLGA